MSRQTSPGLAILAGLFTAVCAGCVTSGTARPSGPTTDHAAATASAATTAQAARSGGPFSSLPTAVEPSIRPLDITTLTGRIVFSAGSHPADDIYVIDADGANLTRLTDDPATDFDPTWSPDGSQIAWRSGRVGEDEIYVMAADGTGQRNLTQRPTEDYSPAWSPSGDVIAFASDNPGLPYIWSIHPDGAGAIQVARAVSGEYPSWSPEGRQLVYVVNTDLEPSFSSDARAGWDLYVIDTHGTSTTRLTSGPGSEKGPAWSPDGDEIAFELSATEPGSPDIWTITADGRTLRRVTWRGGYAPAWSPDGRYIAFSAGGGLAIVSRDGGELGILPTPGLVEPVFADWTP